LTEVTEVGAEGDSSREDLASHVAAVLDLEADHLLVVEVTIGATTDPRRCMMLFAVAVARTAKCHLDHRAVSRSSAATVSPRREVAASLADRQVSEAPDEMIVLAIEIEPLCVQMPPWVATVVQD
jgi:hypothetical protein